MKSRRRIMKLFVFAGLVLVFALSIAPQSAAQNKQLKGTYAVVGEATCRTHWIENPHGGDTSSYFVHSASAQGTITFNGDGTGSGEIWSVDVTHPIYTNIPMGSYWPDPLTEGILGGTSRSYVEFDFTYSVSPDGRISRTITTFHGEFKSGPHVGKTFTQSSFTLTGFVSKDERTIFLSSDPTQDEVITSEIFEDGLFYGKREQECHRSRVLTLLSK